VTTWTSALSALHLFLDAGTASFMMFFGIAYCTLFHHRLSVINHPTTITNILIYNFAITIAMTKTIPNSTRINANTATTPSTTHRDGS